MRRLVPGLRSGASRSCNRPSHSAGEATAGRKRRSATSPVLSPARCGAFASGPSLIRGLLRQPDTASGRSVTKIGFEPSPPTLIKTETLFTLGAGSGAGSGSHLRLDRRARSSF
jgi:hypothetical protein